MEDIKCQKLVVIFGEDKFLFGGPKEASIETSEHFHIEITQLGIRTITIESKNKVSFRELYGIFSKTESLLMLFDGRFFPLVELRFEKCDLDEKNHLDSYANNIMQSRLSYYKSADFCNYSWDKLIDFDSVLTRELLETWNGLLEELDIVHQMFLYSISDSKMPVDIKCAFLIELAEPLVELLKMRTDFYDSLTPENGRMSLKMCIKALIAKYGGDIFAKEFKADYEKFLTAAVNSRVRIMHIKRKQKSLYFNGRESSLYVKKMALLYRRILLELVGVDGSFYREKLLSTVENVNRWNGILDGFLLKIKN